MTKYNKWTPEWEKEIKKLVGPEVERLFKKGEKKLKDFSFSGDEITNAAGETVKVNEIELLIAEVKEQKKQVKTKTAEFKQKGGYAETYVDLAVAHDNLEAKVKAWKDNLKSGNTPAGTPSQNYTKQHHDFLKKSSPAAPDAYRTEGWIKLISDYNQKTFTPAGGSAVPYTNLYEVNLFSGSGHNQTRIRMTEPEAIKFITRTLKEIGKIDQGQFATLTNTVPTGLSPLTFTTTSPNATAIQGQLATLQNHAKNLVEATDEKTGRPEYNFGHGFVKDDQSGMQDTPFGKNEIEVYFDFIDFLSKNSGWLEHAEVKSKVLKEIDSSQTEFIFIPAQAEPYTESKLHSWGVENYLDKSFANSPKKTGFYGDIPRKDWADKAVKYQLERGGIHDWAVLNNQVFNTYFNLNLGKLGTLINSFDTDVYTTLFSDYAKVDDFGSFASNGGHNYNLLNFPQHFYEKNKDLKRLQGLRDAELKRLDTGGEELRKIQAELDQVQQALKNKVTELDNKITAGLQTKRAELKTKFKVSDTETNDFKDDNKIEYFEHLNFQRLIQDIRFLANGDEQAPTGQTGEDTAYQNSKEIWDNHHLLYHSIKSFDSIGFKLGQSEETTKNRTIEDKIAIIKKNEDGQYTDRNLNWYYSEFEEFEKHFKLDSKQTEIKTKLKSAIDNQTPEENIQDWQNNLKEIEAGLETAFTEAKIDEWKKKKEGKDAFNNISSINTLLKDDTIYDTTAKKPKDDFITWLKGKDAKLTSLENLIKEKSPQEVITLIHRYKYNKLDDTKKTEHNNKFGWHKEKKDDKGKFVDTYTPTEDELKDGQEFDTFLYEVAVGKVNYSTLEKPTDSSDNDENKKNEEAPWYSWDSTSGKVLIITGSVLVIAGILTMVFWDKLKKWWGGDDPNQGEGENVDEASEGEE